MTANEIAEMRPTKSTTPPTAPAKATFVIEPDADEVESLAKVIGSGGQFGTARFRLLQRNADRIAKFNRVCPGIAAQVQDIRETIIAATSNYNRVLGETDSAISECQDKLIARGQSLREISAIESKLEQARKTLDSPAVLDLSPADAFRLQQEAAHLPAKTLELTNEATRLESEIRAIGGEHELDLVALVQEMIRATRDEAGRIVGQEVHALDCGGWLQMD